MQRELARGTLGHELLVPEVHLHRLQVVHRAPAVVPHGPGGYLSSSRRVYCERRLPVHSHSALGAEAGAGRAFYHLSQVCEVSQVNPPPPTHPPNVLVLRLSPAVIHQEEDHLELIPGVCVNIPGVYLSLPNCFTSKHLPHVLRLRPEDQRQGEIRREACAVMLSIRRRMGLY